MPSHGGLHEGANHPFKRCCWTCGSRRQEDSTKSSFIRSLVGERMPLSWREQVRYGDRVQDRQMTKRMSALATCLPEKRFLGSDNCRLLPSAEPTLFSAKREPLLYLLWRITIMSEELYLISDVAKRLNVPPHRVAYLFITRKLPEPKLPGQSTSLHQRRGPEGCKDAGSCLAAR